MDIGITILGINIYENRAEKTLNNEQINETILDKIFNDDIMSFIFPNLRLTDKVGNSVMIKEIIK